MQESSDLAGRRAVVTGAAHGIGLGIARRLHDLGARVVAVDKDEAGLLAAGADWDTLAGDLAGDGGQLAGELVRRFGPVELVVNNVGAQSEQSFLALGEKDFDLVFRTNVRGPWFFTKALVQVLIEAGRPGAVLFVSSLHDTFVSRSPAYSASKAAAAMLVRELAVELAPHRIRVNAISPGAIRTRPQPSGSASDDADALIPAGRIGHPDDIASMAAALLSDELAGYVTGANLPVDGGLALFSWMLVPRSG
jgi:glucose 1-dehydrogenase